MFSSPQVHRKHPIVLPHNVVLDWPEINMDDVRQYWNHLTQRGSPLADISPTGEHIPIWLWGDECEFRESGEQILVLVMGLVTDPRTFSAECCYPLCLCRSDSRTSNWSSYLKAFRFCFCLMRLFGTYLNGELFLFCPFSQEINAGFETLRAMLDAVTWQACLFGFFLMQYF